MTARDVPGERASLTGVRWAGSVRVKAQFQSQQVREDQDLTGSRGAGRQKVGPTMDCGGEPR